MIINKKTIFHFTFAAIAGLLVSSTSFADTYKIDTSHSSVNFKIGHMMISSVTGKFTGFDGTIDYDPKKASKIRATGTVDAASIDTDNEKRDAHLRNPDFFDVDKYPKITFETLSVTEKKGKLKATGNLTIKDVTKKVDLDVTINGTVKDPWGNHRLGLVATTTIDRRDFGLTWNKAMETGGIVVGHDVEIELQIEGIKK